ncbi:hypothetical protein HKD37_19G052463 [Glycine soja]
MPFNENNTDSAIKNLETQIGQMAKQLAEQPSTNFSGNAQTNPKEHCQAITTRSGRMLGEVSDENKDEVEEEKDIEKDSGEENREKYERKDENDKEKEKLKGKRMSEKNLSNVRFPYILHGKEEREA